MLLMNAIDTTNATARREIQNTQYTCMAPYRCAESVLALIPFDWRKIRSIVKIWKIWFYNLSLLHMNPTEIAVAIYRAIGDRVRWRGMISVDFSLAKTVGMKSWPYLNRECRLPSRSYLFVSFGPDVWEFACYLQCAQPCVRNNRAWNIKGSKFANSWLPHYESAPMFHKFVPV